MTNRTNLRPRLHALIGDIASDVPDDIAREIECALRDASPAADQSLFLASCRRSASAMRRTARPALHRCSVRLAWHRSAVH